MLASTLTGDEDGEYWVGGKEVFLLRIGMGSLTSE